MKKVKQVEDNEKKQEGKNNLSQLEVSFLNTVFVHGLEEPKHVLSTTSMMGSYTCIYSNPFIATILRPPKSVA